MPNPLKMFLTKSQRRRLQFDKEKQSSIDSCSIVKNEQQKEIEQVFLPEFVEFKTEKDSESSLDSESIYHDKEDNNSCSRQEDKNETVLVCTKQLKNKRFKNVSEKSAENFALDSFDSYSDSAKEDQRINKGKTCLSVASAGSKIIVEKENCMEIKSDQFGDFQERIKDMNKESLGLLQINKNFTENIVCNADPSFYFTKQGKVAFVNQLEDTLSANTLNEPSKCSSCSKVFKRKYALKKHLQKSNCSPKQGEFGLFNESKSKVTDSSSSLESSFNCSICNKTYKSKNGLKKHSMSHDNEKKLLPCPECNEHFENSKYLSIHLRSCHTAKYPKFVCVVCKRSYILRENLEKHMLKHTNQQKFICSVCEKVFTKKVRLKSHMISHGDDRPWQCSICGKMFKRKRALQKHEQTHSGNKPHECPHCGRCFLQRSNLRCHLQLHSGQKNYHCQICKKSFYMKPSLLMHMKTHPPDEGSIGNTMKCLKCQIDVRNIKSSFKNHIKHHKPKSRTLKRPGKFCCHLCGMNFSCKNILLFHLYCHRRSKNPSWCLSCGISFRNSGPLQCRLCRYKKIKQFLCKICGKEFPVIKRFKEHLSRHSKEKYYKCYLCTLCFPDDITFVSHLKNHVEERLYQCKVCSQKVCNRYNYKLHVKLHLK